jgi:hypothetical protein
MRSNTLRAVKPGAERLTQEDVLGRIQRYVDAGEYPLMAAERVTREICEEGRQDELLVLFWPPPLFELWQGARRERPEHGAAERPAAPTAPAQARGRREVLKRAPSLLEGLVEVDGAWRRLGDLDRAACLKAAAIQKRKALARATKARFYHAVAQRLADGQRVQDALGEDALARLLREAAR